MIESFRSRALQNFFEHNDVRGLRPDWVMKITLLLDVIHKAEVIEDVALHGAGFHALKGAMQGRYSVKVNKNWRITFEFLNGYASKIDLEDYHGT
jgi:toxin HigB-1